MKLVDKTEAGINLRGYSKTRNLKLLEEFANSDMQVAEIEDYNHASAKSCQTSFLNSIKNFKMTGIKIKIRGKRVFLVKEI